MSHRLSFDSHTFPWKLTKSHKSGETSRIWCDRATNTRQEGKLVAVVRVPVVREFTYLFLNTTLDAFCPDMRAAESVAADDTAGARI